MNAPIAKFAVFAALATGVAATPALAQLHATDIIIRFNGGTIETGGADATTGLPSFPRRVFPAAFAANGFTNDPGIDSDVGLLTSSQRVGFNFVDGLRIWNGTDFSQYSATPIRIRFGGLSAVTPLFATSAAGFGLAPLSSGQFHRHLGFTLCANPDDPVPCSIIPAEPAVYLLQLTLWTTVQGIADSAPYYLVFNRDADSQVFTDALRFVENSLQAACLLDFNADGFINQEDLAGFLTAFLDESVPAGPSGTGTSPCPNEPLPYSTLGFAADYNRDCTFNQEDLAGFITDYFAESESPSRCIPG